MVRKPRGEGNKVHRRPAGRRDLKKRDKQESPRYRGPSCLRPCCTFAPATPLQIHSGVDSVSAVGSLGAPLDHVDTGEEAFAKERDVLSALRERPAVRVAIIVALILIAVWVVMPSELREILLLEGAFYAAFAFPAVVGGAIAGFLTSTFNAFTHQRHLLRRPHFKELRAGSFRTWAEASATA